MSRYDNSTISEKGRIRKQIMEHIHSSGGRFIRRAGEGGEYNRYWTEISEAEILDRIRRGFRNNKALKKRSAKEVR